MFYFITHFLQSVLFLSQCFLTVFIFHNNMTVTDVRVQLQALVNAVRNLQAPDIRWGISWSAEWLSVFQGLFSMELVFVTHKFTVHSTKWHMNSTSWQNESVHHKYSLLCMFPQGVIKLVRQVLWSPSFLYCCK
jgi:hypothetical protein